MGGSSNKLSWETKDNQLIDPKIAEYAIYITVAIDDQKFQRGQVRKSFISFDSIICSCTNANETQNGFAFEIGIPDISKFGDSIRVKIVYFKENNSYQKEIFLSNLNIVLEPKSMVFSFNSCFSKIRAEMFYVIYGKHNLKILELNHPKVQRDQYMNLIPNLLRQQKNFSV